MTPMILAEMSNLIGDLARANILLALIDNRALTAKELAYAARVSPQTTSFHLGKLTDAKLLQVNKQGRNRYFRLASPLVGQMLETIMVVAGDRRPRLRPISKPSEELRLGASLLRRSCGIFGCRCRGGAENPRVHDSRSGRGATHTARNEFPSRTWNQVRHASKEPACILPAMLGLERAPLSRRRPSRRDFSQFLFGAAVG